MGAASFASPSVLRSSGAVVLACVDGWLRCFGHGGEPSWSIDSGGGPLFATPTPLGCGLGAAGGRDSEALLLGTHCGRLLCIDAAAGCLQWQLALATEDGGGGGGGPAAAAGSRVVASVAIDAALPPPGMPPGWRMVLVAMASPGCAVLVAAPPAEGHPDACPRVLARLPLPGDLFSSPVLHAGLALLGCRDDSLVGLSVAWPEAMQ
jgi:hypothetical protein